MKRLLLFFGVAVIFANTAVAQDYNWGVGIRGGGHMTGATVKYKMNATNALEAMLVFPYNNGFMVTGLYERHIPFNEPGLSLYYGAGAHLGSWGKQFAIGADVVVGVEYKIPRVPLALAVDYKPVFNIPSNRKFYMFDFGVSLKYTL